MRALIPVLGLAVALGAAAAPVTKAVAQLRPTQGSSVEGQVTFTKVDAGVKVSLRLSGLAAGKHGFHIHEFGDCSAPDAASAGGHFNPGAEAHAAPTEAHRHVGDLGNIEAGADGAATFEYVDARASLEGANSILGRGVIVHADPDDFKTQPTGNAGKRLACGVIGAAKGE